MYMSRTLLLLSLTLAYFSIQCERDDICLEGTPGTPRVIVVFRDAQNRSLNKIASGLAVAGTVTTTSIPIAAEDSISVPLNALATNSRFEFRKTLTATQTLIDHLSFHYNRFDVFINRACGYKAQYIFENPAIELTESGWIQSFEVLQDTIANETQTHIYLYH